MIMQVKKAEDTHLFSEGTEGRNSEINNRVSCFQVNTK